ncbi:hypothetical protein ACQKGL_16185 [Ensifer adhaerens]|uniref:hypothetical protein n=1 Tax=Ensifer adhaerens TaxID=106592 RepID=UPI003CFCEC5A
MPGSVCETYPGICEKGRLKYPRPPRLLRAANQNLPGVRRPTSPTPIALTLPVDGESVSAIRIGSAISMLGLLILAAHAEMTAAAGVFAGALDGLLMDVSSILW